MDTGQTDWAGVSFRALHHHDGRFIRAPGLFAFARWDASCGPVLLYADHAESIALKAGAYHPAWLDALQLGMNTLYVSFPIPVRIDRLQLLSRVIRRAQPILNVVAQAHAPYELQAAPRRVAGAA